MKRQSLLAFGAVTFLIGAIAGSFFGCTTTPPTALEQRYFNITTNPPVIAVTTNVFSVTLYKTNEVTQTVTNVQGVLEYKTNVIVIPQTVLQTNLAVVTNEPQTYNLVPKPEAIQPIQNIGGAIANLFGAGGLVTTAIGAVFSIWGLVRSRKTSATAVGLAQTIETMRSFVQQLPNGGTYDAALVQWMQQHQAETGTINQVLGLLANEVSNPDAQVAAEHIRAAIAALGVTLPPPPPKV